MARLPQGTRKRDDGMLEKRFSVSGKRYSIYGANSKELAEKEQNLREKIKNGLYTENMNLTFDKYFSEWLEQKRGRVKSSSLRIYGGLYRNHISPILGKAKLQKIERRQVLSFQKKLTEKNLSVTTCNSAMLVLEMILGDAVRDEIILKNPCAGIKGLKDDCVKASETYHRALTTEEQRDFMEEMRDDFHYELVSFLLCTGCRFGEAAALQWSDIDWKANVIHITKTVAYNEENKRVVGSAKTASSVRDIPMNEIIQRILKSQREKQGVVVGIQNLVFTGINGKMVNNQIINKAIRNALDRLAEKGKPMEHFSCHALRDTFATRYVESGGSLQTLKTILGHSSLAMTADLYAHVLPNTKQEEMTRVQIVI